MSLLRWNFEFSAGVRLLSIWILRVRHQDELSAVQLLGASQVGIHDQVLHSRNHSFKTGLGRPVRSKIDYSPGLVPRINQIAF